MLKMFRRREPIVVLVSADTFDELAELLPGRVSLAGTLDMGDFLLTRGPERQSGEMPHDALAEHRRRVISNAPKHPCG